jgi:hypothetical protein
MAISNPAQLKTQIENLIRETDYLVRRYRTTGDKAQLVETIKLQAQVIDSLTRLAGMDSNPERLTNLRELK